MKNFERCRTKFGMTGKLAAIVFATVLILASFTGCPNPSSGGVPP